MRQTISVLEFGRWTCTTTQTPYKCNMKYHIGKQEGKYYIGEIQKRSACSQYRRKNATTEVHLFTPDSLPSQYPARRKEQTKNIACGIYLARRGCDSSPLILFSINMIEGVGRDHNLYTHVPGTFNVTRCGCAFTDFEKKKSCKASRALQHDQAAHETTEATTSTRHLE